MSPSDFWLIAFAILCLLLGLAFGLAMSRARLWRWADPIYYPLAILGVILLFIASERNRTIDDLRVQQAQIARDLSDLEQSHPKATPQDIGAPSFKSSYDLLMVRAELGRACKFSPEIKCGVARGHEQLITSFFEGFSPPESLSNDAASSRIIQDYCRRGFQLIDALESKGGTYSLVFGRLKSSFAELAKKNLSPYEFPVTNESQKMLREELGAEGASLLLRTPVNLRDTVRDMWEANSSFADNLHSALSMCVRIPSKAIEQLEVMTRWNEEQARCVATREEVNKRLEEVQRDQAPWSPMRIVLAFIMSRLWPYVLVIALSLKFAKGIASLR